MRKLRRKQPNLFIPQAQSHSAGWSEVNAAWTKPEPPGSAPLFVYVIGKFCQCFDSRVIYKVTSIQVQLK